MNTKRGLEIINKELEKKLNQIKHLTQESDVVSFKLAYQKIRYMLDFLINEKDISEKEFKEIAEERFENLY